MPKFKKQKTPKNFDYQNALLNDREKLSWEDKNYFENRGFDDCLTINDTLNAAFKLYAPRILFGKRKHNENGELGDFAWLTFEQSQHLIYAFANGLDLLAGSISAISKNVGIYSKNVPEWQIASFANFFIGNITVALYDTLGKDAVSYIVAHSEIEIIVCSTENLDKLLAIVKSGDGSGLKAIVCIDGSPVFNNSIANKISDESRAMANSLGVKLMGFYSVVESGKLEMEKFKPFTQSPENLCFIMYTSGTSGTPKGVMISHKNVMSVLRNGLSKILMNIEGSLLSFLPLAHIFETVLEIFIVIIGGSIGYYSGDSRKLSEDILKLKPTYFAGVPRVFERMYNKIVSTARSSGYVTKSLFNFALKSGAKNRRSKNFSSAHKGYIENYVFSKVRHRAGLENLKFVITGSAPCPPYILEFLRVLTDGTVIQGYGLTETAAVISITPPSDVHMCNVGLSVGCDVKLVKVEDTNYDPDGAKYSEGEICVRGDNVFEGYYKEKEMTSQVMTDGWFHTGDVGRINPNGTLSIIDRKKCIFKLAQGEYISPEKIEQVYSKCPAVNQIFVHGDSYYNHIVSIVVPDVALTVEHLKKKLGEKVSVLESSLAQRRVDDEFLANFEALCSKNRDGIEEWLAEQVAKYDEELKGFEKARKIAGEFRLDKELNGFTVDNECMTPSFKLRRTFLLKRYQKEIEDLYRKKI